MINANNPKPKEELLSRREFLSLRILPAKLKTEEAAWLLGFPPGAMTFLVRYGLLTPLVGTAPNSRKGYATVVIERLRSDVTWLQKAHAIVSKYWKDKNARKSVNCHPDEEEN